jgi:hypothetical protein
MSGIADIAGRDISAFHPDWSDWFDVFRRLFAFHVAGVEVTQAIQYYHSSQHLTDPADRQPDNAVSLVANKPAWVRVYVRSGLRGGDIAGVTGSVEVQRRHFGVVYLPLTTLGPQPPGTVTAHPSVAYATERGTLSYSLNFIIPADDMCGHLKLVVRATTPDGRTDTFDLLLNATLKQTLRLRGVMVGYNGPSSTAAGAPNITRAAPTIADLQTTSTWALLTFPVQSAATYSSAGTITLTVPLSDAPSCAGCCTPNWLTLNSQVAAQVTADGNRTDVLYYGLIASGVPMGPIVGCESSGVSAGGVGNGVTLAHELGHHCGFPHAPCGNVGTPDATYPAYEPYDPANTPQASIGEYGLDISNGNVMSPAMFKDMMSYCWPKWISLHNHGKLLNHPKLDPGRVCVDNIFWRDIVLYEPQLIPEKWLPDPPPDRWDYRREVEPEPIISIIGVMRSERELEITSVMRLETRPAPVGGKPTNMSASLVGSNEEVLADAPVFELRSQADGCGCHEGSAQHQRFPVIVQALVPAAGKGSAIMIRRGDEPLWTREAPERAPRIRGFEARVGQESLELAWEIDAAHEEPEVWVQWASGQGGEWRALATGLKGGRAELSASALPPGACRLRLLASDGFFTTTSKLVRLRVPERGPEVAILTPRDGQTLVAGSSMRLYGAVTDPHEPDGAPPEVRWLIDGKNAAHAIDTFLPAPPPGRHRLEFVVGRGRRRSTAKIEFATIKPPYVEEEPHQPRPE